MTWILKTFFQNGTSTEWTIFNKEFYRHIKDFLRRYDNGELGTSYDNNLELELLNSWWRHQMQTFSAWLAICAGNSPVPVNSPHKGQWRGALMFSLICVWINGWVNNREAGDLRRYLAYCDVTVMSSFAVGEVEAAFDHLKNNKSPGRDYIPAEFVKHYMSSGDLTIVFNYINESGDFPGVWAEWRRFTIYKPASENWLVTIEG